VPQKLDPNDTAREVIVIGGGIAGLSAAIYLGRAQREILVIDSGKSMARWEPEVQNYFGFPEGISGEELLQRGTEHARRYGVESTSDEIVAAHKENAVFYLKGNSRTYSARRLLVATGIYHLPPKLEGVVECLGHTMFFCKDCDGIRVRGKTILIYGWNNEAVEYALAMLLYSPVVGLVLDAHQPVWDATHDHWLREHAIPVYPGKIVGVERDGCQLQGLIFAEDTKVEVQALFTTRGDVYLNKLARELGAAVDDEGQIIVDRCMATNVQGLYAAGCVTPANCQMIIAAGEGAKAAQAINRDLFVESLQTHTLRRYRKEQLETTETEPTLVPAES
jgi:thioredoxin reductase (NADPH)